ncbi:MAG: glutamine synthetase type III, partial [Lachnospiraceae bacterium]|nr:glutamine synthetase type III [Lachnospiraceae bacterium]
AHVLPHITKDTTDRNRTSPFAFTGNKFEFRMPGSALSVADPNIVLNTAVAEELRRMYDKLKDVAADKLEEEVTKLLRAMLLDHKKVLFNGNGYTDEWIEEAEKRGLYNLKSLPQAMPRLVADKNKKLFTDHGIYTDAEVEARYEINLENYSKTIHIESLALQEMVRKDFTGSLVSYMKDLTEEALQKKSLLGDGATYEADVLKKLDAEAASIGKSLAKLTEDTAKAEAMDDELAKATSYYETILSDMDVLRASVDAAESLIPEKYLSYPTYGQLLFSLR